jgi:oxygen-independent coproporphyrinogen-3 oxidase
VQDFNPTVQKAIHRWQSPEEVMKVTAQARALGYRSVNYDLVYGLPFQHHDGFSDTLAQVIAMRPDRIALYAYAHVPWKHPGQRAYDAQDLPAPAEKLALFNMGRDALLKAGYNSIGLDHFALPNDSLSKAYHDGTVHRNFMGYTDLRTDILIGLGVSAISDIGSAYAQNVKTVEHYRALLAQSQSPISKGHMLNNEEITIAAHILNLMCGHKTSWKNANEETRQYFELRKSALSSLAADGLIELDSDSIVVKDKGKVLVRNVCAAIDMHFSPSAGQPKFAAAI